jgi:predicted secreted protein
MNRFLLCGIALLLTACGPAHTVSKTEKPPVLVKIDIERNGSAIVLKRGEALRVILPGDPRSGYIWEVAQVDDALLRQAGPAVFVPNEDPAMGAGFFYFTFPVVRTGITPLRIVYRHAHDMDRKPLKVFLVLITITDE